MAYSKFDIPGWLNNLMNTPDPVIADNSLIKLKNPDGGTKEYAVLDARMFKHTDHCQFVIMTDDGEFLLEMEYNDGKH